MNAQMQLGLDTFGDVTSNSAGEPTSHAQVIRDVVEEAILADELRVDSFGLGEHHRADFAVSSPEMVLAAVAARTQRILIGSAVTVLSSDDPVRVYQRFATLDALSNGRAEVILGRGSFTESFPLFGFDLSQYEQLFDEKLSLFSKLITGQTVTWSGSSRAPLQNQRVFPSLERPSLRTWIGVGGSPQSVVRAAKFGMPLMLAVISGDPGRFQPYVDLYHQATKRFGQSGSVVGVHSPGYVAETDGDAMEQFWAGYKHMRDTIGAERGWPPMDRAEYDREIASGSLYVGSPETVAHKIAKTVKALNAERFDLKYSAGRLSHARMMRNIELYGTRVIPIVRDILA